MSDVSELKELPNQAAVSRLSFSPSSGLIVANGWALGQLVAIHISSKAGEALGQAEYGQSRQDVSKQFPDYENDAPGWSFRGLHKGDLGDLEPVVVKFQFENQIISLERQVEITDELRLDKYSLAGQAELLYLQKKLSKYIDIDAQDLDEVWPSVATRQDADQAILDAVLSGDILTMKNCTLRIADRSSARTLLHEIFVREEYYFSAEDPEPYIIDGGAHSGFSIAYFKSLYPDARIVAFEPDASNRNLTAENVSTNAWSNVALEPYALGGSDGVAEFFVSSVDSMAGTLTHRLHEKKQLGEMVTVNVRSLRPWIDRQVDLLKLDIEGAEYDVFNDIEENLHLIKMIVCEVHIDATNQDKFAKLLSQLADHGFICELARAWFFALPENLGHPLDTAGRPYSLTLWARRPAR